MGRKLIKRHAAGEHEARVHKHPDYGYQVTFYHKGKKAKGRTEPHYETSDEDDAHATAQAELKKLHGKNESMERLFNLLVEEYDSIMKTALGSNRTLKMLKQRGKELTASGKVNQSDAKEYHYVKAGLKRHKAAKESALDTLRKRRTWDRSNPYYKKAQAKKDN